MKTLFLTCIGFFTSIVIALGGGNTSIVHLTEVHSVKVEAQKITIVGTGYVEMRIITKNNPSQHGLFETSDKFVDVITTRGTFVIIPYFSDPAIKGVPTGGHDAAVLKKLSKQWWDEMKQTYASVKIGDNITIGYQEDQVTISEFQIQKIIGAGSLTINPKNYKAEAISPAPPASLLESK